MKIYRTCDEIPLSNFICMYKGDLSSLVISGNPDSSDLIKAASMLIEEYCNIIGNKNLISEIRNYSKLLDYNSKLILLDGVRQMIKSKMYKESSEVLLLIGVKQQVNEKTLQKIIKGIESLYAETSMRMELLKRKTETKEKVSNKDVDFTKERMMVSAHFKMHIDPKIYTASEYGHLVRMMVEELKEIENYGKRN